MFYQSPRQCRFSVVVILMFTGSLAAQNVDDAYFHWPERLRTEGAVMVSGSFAAVNKSTVFNFASLANDGESRVVCLTFGDLPNKSTLFSEYDETTDWVYVSAAEVGDDDLKGCTMIVLVSQDAKADFARQFKSVRTSIRELLSKGGVVWGIGPIAEYLGRFRYQSAFEMSFLTEELNAIPDTVIMTGYHDGTLRNELLSVLARIPRSVGIGVPEDATIIFKGRKLLAEGESRVTLALMANEYRPLKVRHVGTVKRGNEYDNLIDLTAWRRDAIERTLPKFPADNPPAPVVNQGALFIAGGGLPDQLMERFVARAGGDKARLVYIPCTESEKLSSQPTLIRRWREMGVASASLFHTKDRIKANKDEQFLKILKEATGIWFGGGRQWNFADSYYGTRAHQEMKNVLSRDGVIGGSSAGASIQADYLARGNPIGNLDMMADGYERGLGFLTGVAIDQHFSQRGRQKDMTHLVNRYPQLLGIGIDEKTALIVEKSNAKVVGDGKVFFFDRRKPVVPGEPDYEVVSAGETYDLANRKLLAEVDPPAVAVEKPQFTPEERNVIDKATRRLVELQHEDGAWPYEGVYRVRGKIPVGYRVGGTAIAIEALLNSPFGDSDKKLKAINAGIEFLSRELKDKRMEPSQVNTYDVRVWGHIYALNTYCQLAGSSNFASRKNEFVEQAKLLSETLLTEELRTGGWNYANRRNHACFVTAPAVQALLRARSLGISVPREVFERSAAALTSSRSEDGAYQYSGPVGRRADRLPGSIARSPISEVTLSLLGKGDIANVPEAIAAFHEHWNELEKRRKKTGTHVPPYGVAPYYFYYGHRYLGQAIQLLPIEDQDDAYKKFEKVLMRTQDADGTWNDRVFEQSRAFGTSMSLLALCRNCSPMPEALADD